MKLFALILLVNGLSASAGNLPNVADEMLDPEYWVKRAAKPDAAMMTPGQVDGVNKGIRRAGYRIRPWKESPRVAGRRVSAYIESDLEALVHWRKYDIENRRMRDPYFSNRMRSLIGLSRIKNSIAVRYGLTVRTTRVRSMPTAMFVMRKPDDRAFDILQNSVIDPGQEVVLYHVSEDGEWGYVQAPSCRGWIELQNAGFVDDPAAIVYPPARAEYLVVAGKEAAVYSDPEFRNPLTMFSMGSRIPLGETTQSGREAVVPLRSADGSLSLGKGYFKRDAEVGEGPLVFTPRSLARQAFRFLGEPYGWGGTGGSVDCSRFVVNVLGVFGFEMPRTSFLQVKSFDRIEAPQNDGERRRLLDSIEPLGGLLEFPGHVGFYLGKSGGRYYVIHSTSSYRSRENGEEREIKVDRVVVSDLSLGETGRDGSLFKRMKAVALFR